MDRDQYLQLMRFPPEWEKWGMIPESFLAEQSALYEPGHEGASEHDRHGVFQWWLRQEPDTDTLVVLVRLSWLDPDRHMGNYVRECIGKLPGFGPDVAIEIAKPYHRA